MPHLKCYEKGCASNHCTHCVLSRIHVGSNALCESFSQRTKENEHQAEFEFEFAQDLEMATRLDGHNVHCDNRMCRFQESGACHHEHVRIEGVPQGPICASFLPR